MTTCLGLKRRHVPNWLTLSRIALIPPIAFLFLYGHDVIGSIFAVAAFLTDWFDGSLAEKWDARSTFGKI